MKERSRPIPGYAGFYKISTKGRVWTCRKLGKVRDLKGIWVRMKVTKTKRHGYPAVNLTLNGKPRLRSIHILVLETFVGSRPKGMIARHLNGNKSDCRLSNLKWGTHEENEKDKLAHGTFKHPKGSEIGTSKLTERKVRKIKRLREKGLSQARIGKILNVHQTTVCYILRGKTWKHVK